MKFDYNTTLSCRIVPGSRAVRCVTLSLSIQYNKIRVSSEASPFTAREGPSTHQDLTGQGLISTTADEVDAASEITGRGWQRTTFGRHRYVATWLPTASKIRCPDRDKFRLAPDGAVKIPTLSLAGCKAPGPPGRTEKHPAPAYGVRYSRAVTPEKIPAVRSVCQGSGQFHQVFCVQS